MKPKEPHLEETRDQVLKTAQEWMVCTVLNAFSLAVVKDLPGGLKVLSSSFVVDTLLYEVGDVLEIDELWSFALEKEQKRWIWIAACRRIRQLLAFYVGQRATEASAFTCGERHKSCHLRLIPYQFLK